MHKLAAGLAIFVLAGGTVAGAALFKGDDPTLEPGQNASMPERGFSTNDPVKRACGLEEDELLRLYRGHDPAHSEDVTIVPLAPNYSGAFTTTSHSGPWDYLQQIPLVFYGPGVVPETGQVDDPASLADIYPTMSGLTGVDLAERDGTALEAVTGPVTSPLASPPRLVVMIVWDGVGRNVLDRWPAAWPNLARLEREGVSFLDAEVGSSPSITPASHSTMGTGAFPIHHGVTAIEYRDDEGDVRDPFPGKDPGSLKLSTFADDIDLALDNVPKVGLLAWKAWHLGMMGHGKGLSGGDADELAIIGTKGTVSTNPRFYSMQSWLNKLEGPTEEAEELDRADGEVDGLWRGHEILGDHDNPAWVRYEEKILLRMLADGGYGADETTDFFFVNMKPTDIVGHRYTMDAPEEKAVLKAQDQALGSVIEQLDATVDDYVVIVTADHGHTPSAERSGAWPVFQGELYDDINAHFEVPPGESIIIATSAAGPFLNRPLMKDMKLTSAKVARFLNGYTIAENYNQDTVPAEFRGREDEPILEAAFASKQYPDVMRCKFGTPTP